MLEKCKDIEEITKKRFCNYHQNNCFECVYRLTDKYGLWCIVEGEYVYKYKVSVK